MDKNTLTALTKDVYRLTLLFPTREPLRYKLREAADDIIFEFLMKKNDYLGCLERHLEVIDSYFQIALSQDWVAPARIDEARNSYLRAGEEIREIKLTQEAATEIIVKEEAKPAASFEETAPSTDFVIVSEETKTSIICPLPKDLMEPPAAATPMIAPESPADKSGEKENKSEADRARAFATVNIPDVIIEAESGLEDGGLEDVGGEEGEERGGLTNGQIVRQNRIAEFLKENGSAQVWEILKIFPNVSKRTIRRDFRSMLKQGLIERTGERNTTAYKLKINIS